MQSAQFQLHADIEQRHWWFVARRRILRSVVGQLLPPSPCSTVIDVGCGTGGNIAALADEYRCVGIDTSAEAIQLARSRFQNVQFIHGFAPADLGSQAAEARLVLMMDVLEHVPDDFSLFSSVASSLSPGTLMLITVPANQRLWSGHDESFGHYRRYDLARLTQIWAGLAVKPLLVSYFNCRLYPLIKTVRTLNRWRGGVAGQSGTDFRLPAKPVNRLLENIFAGEGAALCGAIGQKHPHYRRGVSLMAVLERQDAAVAPRSKPAGLPKDYFDPQSLAVR